MVAPRARLVELFTPVPVRLTVSDGAGLLLATVSVPVSAPVAVGANFTDTVQLAPAASEDPQVFVCVKLPVTETPEMVCALLPGLAMVTVWAAELVPVFTSPKARLAGVAVSAPATTGLGKVVSTGVVLQPELPGPAFSVNVPLPDG